MIAANLASVHDSGTFWELSLSRIATIDHMTLDELERDYVSLRQQSEAVRSYL